MVSLSDPPVALVTGASGFTGRYVCEALAAAGYRVRKWGRTPGESREFSDDIDLLDSKAVEADVRAVLPSIVVHLAAISFVAHGDVDEIYRVNVVGTRNLLAALASQQSRPSRVILASSANIYGNAGGVIDELQTPAPQNDYAVSKLAMEYMAKLWFETLPITIVRPFNYSGVGQSEKFLLPKIVSHFKCREPVLELGNLDVSRDFYDVRCVAEAYKRLAMSEPTSPVINVCSGQEHSLRMVLELMTKISGHHLEVRVNPDFVRANEVKRLKGDNRRLLAEVGALPAISLEDTLRWMYETG